MLDEERLAQLERRLELIGARIEEVAGRIGDRLEYKATRCSFSNGRLFWGMVFLLAGLIWFGKEQGWIPFDLPFWPLALILLGVYFLLTTLRRN